MRENSVDWLNLNLFWLRCLQHKISKVVLEWVCLPLHVGTVIFMIYWTSVGRKGNLAQEALNEPEMCWGKESHWTCWSRGVELGRAADELK